MTCWWPTIRDTIHDPLKSVYGKYESSLSIKLLVFNILLFTNSIPLVSWDNLNQSFEVPPLVVPPGSSYSNCVPTSTVKPVSLDIHVSVSQSLISQYSSMFVKEMLVLDPTHTLSPFCNPIRSSSNTSSSSSFRHDSSIPKWGDCYSLLSTQNSSLYYICWTDEFSNKSETILPEIQETPILKIGRKSVRHGVVDPGPWILHKYIDSCDTMNLQGYEGAWRIKRNVNLTSGH